MAQFESDRDDLFAELKTACNRWELQPVGMTGTIVAGIRSDERLSLYFGPDVCFHFDGEHRLKRAYVHPFLYRTQGDTLARLHRHRTPSQTELQRHDLQQQELADFCREMLHLLHRLHAALVVGEYQLLRSAGGSVDLLTRELGGCLNQQGALAKAFPTRRSRPEKPDAKTDRRET
jgi:hypothetical protein